MKHCSFQRLISSYFDGELSSAERLSIEQHVAHCQDCQTFLRELHIYRHAIQETATLKYEPVLTRRILEKVYETQHGLTAWITFEKYVRRTLIAFAIVIVIFFTALYLMLQKPVNDYSSQQFSVISDSSASIFYIPQEEITKHDIAYAVLTSD
ncbi:MAG: zf-HC2 domain-containing protein [Bacteroidetes bacterium]|nr:zf-HC2 domain-containing protein [Bacteroidota bacterium]